MTIDPRTPTMSEMEHVGLSPNQADIACTKREAPRGVRRVARGVNCILSVGRGGACSEEKG